VEKIGGDPQSMIRLSNEAIIDIEEGSIKYLQVIA
jgi:hypothetical protein